MTPQAEPAMRWETVSQDLLKAIYDSDQAMYPAPELTYSRLKSWVDARPELCLCLRSTLGLGSTLTIEGDKEVLGIILMLPLKPSFWDRLRGGLISEHDVDPATMYPSLGKDPGNERFETGLHVFHIERFSTFTRTCQGVSFTAFALEEIRSRIARTFESWDVVGYSALTATKKGSAAFRRLGFTSSASEAGTTLLSDTAEMVERGSNDAFLSRAR